MSNPMSVVPRASLIPLDDFLGAWLIGLIVSAVLYGFTCLQVYLYYTKHSARDPAFLKSFVAILIGLDTLHLAFLSHSFYSTAVTNFGDYVELGKPPWSLLIQIFVGVLLSTLVQLFYAYRIYTISAKSLVFPIIIVCGRPALTSDVHETLQGICALAELGLSIGYMNKAFQIKFFKLAKADVPYSTSALAFEVACDVLIASAMMYHLFKNKTGFEKTNKAINLLVTYSVNSGVVTMIFAIASLVTWLTSTTTLIYAPFFFVLVRFYGLSFMSILNSREYIREQMNSSHAMLSLPSYAPNSDGTTSTVLHVRSQTTKITSSDYDGKVESV
ncbi:hypothetical protein DFH08DRAFT_1078011 [Mycena albidolilacea]|uniref:DUF6534 domain-containing protein n=1 Tax=Mycena albidolilacea TaxID=1033008 RepID=A0AAD7A8U8_9AGAR|nr:hypothetical protein DFH08DRAFT_1078011 [Mycena albidolilacea]